MMCSCRRIRFLPAVAIGLGLVLSGCLQTQTARLPAEPVTAQPIPRDEPGAYKVGDAYRVGGIWYYPKVNYAYRAMGIASWYGPGFHGRPTANGETFDQNDLTAAHRTLPMPSMVRVTNLDNGRSIKLRINDRGPFSNGRIIDVSRRAADLLGFRRQGTAKVRVEIVEEESRALAAVAFAEVAAAHAPDAAPMVPVEVVELQPSMRSAAPATQATTTPANQTAMAAPRPVETPRFRHLLAPAPDGIVTRVPVESSRIFVQAGSFTRLDNAHKLRARLVKVGKAKIARATIADRRYFRVRFGPMASVADADRLLAVLIDNGHTEARVVVD